jgi:hypothetical protein
MTAARSQRATHRIWPFVVSCHVVQGDRRIPGYLTELSGAGARVLCHEEPPPTGSAVVLEVRLGRRPTRSAFPANVVWSGDGPAAARVFGLAFGEIGSDERRLLDAVVEDFQRRAAELG